ncbi:MAG: hypothetical protein ACRDI2_24930 [Chloroflexota bacterium]
MSTLLRWAELWALLLCLIALAASGFFGMMAWMARVPLHTARRWFRWSLYPAAIWLLALVIGRLLA